MRTRWVAPALRAGSLAARFAAWGVSAMVVADALLGTGARTWLLSVNGAVARLVPGPVLGLLVFQTPFGGAFRGDFALLAVILLLIDWALAHVRASLR